MNLLAGLSGLMVLAAEDPTEHVANKHFLSGDLFGRNVWLVVVPRREPVPRGSYDPGARRRGLAGQDGTRDTTYVTKGTLAHMIEVMVVYLRDNSIRPVLGERTERFMPFLISLFFFILMNNLLGLTPVTDLLHITEHYTGGGDGPAGATATQNIFVTGALVRSRAWSSISRE